MKKKFYQVIKDGQILAVRKSHRDYTHAVVTWKSFRYILGGEQVPAERHVASVSYCGSLALAQKEAGKSGDKGTDKEIIPVIVK